MIYTGMSTGYGHNTAYVSTIAAGFMTGTDQQDAAPFISSTGRTMLPFSQISLT
jgi:hypothetical protein